MFFLCRFFKSKFLRVRVGSTKTYNGGKVYGIRRRIIHEKYDSQHDYDIALLRLNRPLKFNSRIVSITLPERNETLMDGTKCHASGFGATLSPIEPKNRLRMVMVPIFNQTKCIDVYKDDRTVTDRMLCAGWQGGAKDCE